MLVALIDELIDTLENAYGPDSEALLEEVDISEVLAALKIKRALDYRIEAVKEDIKYGEKNIKEFAQLERWGLVSDSIDTNNLRHAVSIELEQIRMEADRV